MAGEPQNSSPPRPRLLPPGAGSPMLLPLALLLILWILAFAQYPRLPDILPSRFVPWGKPVGWSPKNPAYFVLPATGTVIAALLGLVRMVALRNPVIDGQALRGPAARAVGRMISRYLFFMCSALLAYLLNIEFRITQMAYGARETLGWDSYLTAGLIVTSGAIGASLLLRGARRWLSWQQRQGEQTRLD